ncbi:Down syndrome cell adhesion molecule-like protein Dscam2 isoform X1 [Varroa destructor]|uniref:Ig-like domain-containing protein n=1 Tax=Varroa destructor TaxID=109461 RepID=A0A7M7MBB1_VARDE|nr:Down syndrome cell adhesion molecule-like protein Dscam2 isoform X1 [Varroa destructor]
MDIFYVTVVHVIFFFVSNVLCTKDRPKVQPFNLPTNPELCDDVHTLCTAKSSTHTQLEWLKDGARISDAFLPNATVSHIGSALVLNIQCISLAHTGNYTCLAQNPYGKDAFTTSLVITSPPFWLEDTGVERTQLIRQFNRGDMITLQCPVGGHPKPNITWYRRDNLVATSDTFSFKTVDYESTDKVTCKASNGIGFSLQRTFNIQTITQVVSVGDHLKLTIVDRSAAGELICRASNGIAPSIEKTFTIYIICIPIH